MTELEKEDLLKILDTIHDGIYVTKPDGTTVWVNEASCNILKKSREELLKRNVFDLEKEGVFTPSITELMLEEPHSVSLIQHIGNTGSKSLVSGHLIKDENGDPKWVVTHGRELNTDIVSSTQYEEVEAVLNRYIQELRERRINHEEEDVQSLVGENPLIKRTVEQAEKIAGVEASVLITGETGVGKNVFANYIHKLSDRYNQPFIQVNCGAIPESLFESELFGYKKGAFTGASEKGKIGLVEVAEGGTLFLDEIGELPLSLQVKILQLIQDKTYLPVGEVETRSADVRIIAATNKDLIKLVEEKKFRDDLYYRLNVLSIHVPPLRERPDDIFLLVQHFTNSYNKKYTFNKWFTGEAIDEFQAYSWPGNIRELSNVVERTLVMSDHQEIGVGDLPANIRDADPFANKPRIAESGPLREYLEQIEKNYIEHAVKHTKTTREAANILEIPQSTLMRKIKKYNLNKK